LVVVAVVVTLVVDVVKVVEVVFAVVFRKCQLMILEMLQKLDLPWR
jgi:hypothetical protein